MHMPGSTIEMKVKGLYFQLLGERKVVKLRLVEGVIDEVLVRLKDECK